MKFLVGALFAPQPASPPPQAQIGGLYGIIDAIYEILTFVNSRIDISINILSVGSFCPPPCPPPWGLGGLWRNTDVIFEILTIENPRIDITHDISSWGFFFAPQPSPIRCPQI